MGSDDSRLPQLGPRVLIIALLGLGGLQRLDSNISDGTAGEARRVIRRADGEDTADRVDGVAGQAIVVLDALGHSVVLPLLVGVLPTGSKIPNRDDSDLGVRDGRHRRGSTRPLADGRKGMSC